MHYFLYLYIIVINFLILLSIYHYILTNYTLRSLPQGSFAFPACALFISLTKSVNGAQFLSITWLMLLSGATDYLALT